MPMRDYRCDGCGARFEALSRARTLVASPCPACGHEATPVLSVFGLKVYQVDRSNFALIAPAGADGKPMTLTEAQRSAATGSYRRGDHDRMLQHDAERNRQRVEVNRERAKRDAWREVSARTRTVIRG